VLGSSGTGIGVYGGSFSTWGVKGAGVSGVLGEAGPSGYGVQGSTTGGATVAGVYGVSTGANGNGVIGEANNGTGAYGVWGKSSGGYGVSGTSTSGTGVYGESTSGTGMYGFSASSYGVTGVSGAASNGRGVNGYSDCGSCSGVYGSSNSGWGVNGFSPNGWGVQGISNAPSNGRGVSGGSDCASCSGVLGGSNNGYGVYGYSSTGYAGYFQGNVHVTGSLSKGGGSFKIDHPLDPKNKYLYHSFVESPDMMNVYNGNVTTDARGEAVIMLPNWFEALNKDFRYQLTSMGQFAQAIVFKEIENNRFTVKTDRPNVKVSWQVTGIRHDPYANEHRIPVEENKAPEEKGLYLYPTEYGQPESKGIDYQRIKQVEQNPPTQTKQAPGR
jgi:hypothetical protein